ncbi:cysteine-rich motor neuron 1 protein-like isoform X2 [Paramacrobiotus metropolitanus]|uniref:cysteine-rich motor neuron 1 protein-like isoform X2 n=1 Tax=Paramacrobiotus metropolitanus TaxID=2943436 RepID=UPI002446196A|nr:cysteine-rich motor neuron 1 protein-like isoform X2 [Paramacrobiotus metropolitanus]XP_055329203.1 cysteine-rich motor neuron 1 protein-like isoform X2 [Paramacrobiotus metropolitanus]
MISRCSDHNVLQLRYSKLLCVSIYTIVLISDLIAASNARCPGDSQYLPELDICQCYPCPEQPLCLFGTQLDLLQTAEGIPGRCCPDYGCIPIKEHDCTGVTCPPENISCPDDSVLLAGVLHPDQCCPTPSRCQCKAKCPPTVCPRATSMTMIRRATHAPGSCCDRFVCTSVQQRSSRTNDSATDRLTCLYDNEEYMDGENWTDGDCIKCQCKGGIAFCSHEQCPRLHCDQPILKKGTCCPSCDGCVTAAGVTHKEFDVWKEDDCVHCSCENGQIRCRIEDCQANCRNPKKIDGQCCPVCDNDDVSFVAFPTNCPQHKCEKLCRHGYVNDSNGCYKCECTVENCTLTCEFGYETDTISGEATCSCLRNTVQEARNLIGNISAMCPNATNCTDTSCRLNHDQPDANGCPRCVCDRCPEFRIEKCPVDCIHGYQYDAKQCLTCNCISQDDADDHHILTSSTDSVSTSSSIYIAYTSSEENLTQSTTSSLSVSAKTTLASPLPEAALRSVLCANGTEEMHPWTEGCHTCICYNGRKLCDVQFCQKPDQKRPENASDQECCDNIYGSRSEFSQPPKTLCEALPDGTPIGDSHWLPMKLCGTCICQKGIIYCTEDPCPLDVCNGTLVQQDFACCPSCIDHPENDHSTQLPANHRAQTGCQTQQQTFPSGATWWESACRSCQCINGAVQCQEVQCSKLDCDLAIRQKGKCCDTCLNTTLDVGCIYGGKTFRSRDHWKPSECSSCACSDGQVICEELNCLPLCRINSLGPCCNGCNFETKLHTKKVNDNTNASPTEAPYQAEWMFPFFIIVIFLIIILIALFLLVKKCRNKRTILYSRPEVTRLESPDTASSSKASTLHKPQQSSFFFSVKKNQVPV